MFVSTCIHSGINKVKVITTKIEKDSLPRFPTKYHHSFSVVQFIHFYMFMISPDKVQKEMSHRLKRKMNGTEM